LPGLIGNVAWVRTTHQTPRQPGSPSEGAENYADLARHTYKVLLSRAGCSSRGRMQRAYATL